MHACGHDAHAVMALGASLALWGCREHLPWDVPWRVIFQPAEETGEGAAEMVAAGAVENVRAIVALHVDPELGVGAVGRRDGVMTAYCQELRLAVRGEGGHAARPHQTIDPIAAAVQFIATVYQTVPRAVDAREAAVVTFGAVHGGDGANVIPERVDVAGTVRTLNWRAAQKVEDLLRRIARGISEGSGAALEVTLAHGVDAVVNDPWVTAVCTRAAIDVVGERGIVMIDRPSMGGEDFAGYLAHAPGCLMRLGVASDDRPRHFLHSPYFDIDERALTIGAKILARAIVRLCEPSRANP
jgi:amidohydrolase